MPRTSSSTCIHSTHISAPMIEAKPHTATESHIHIQFRCCCMGCLSPLGLQSQSSRQSARAASVIHTAQPQAEASRRTTPRINFASFPALTLGKFSSRKLFKSSVKEAATGPRPHNRENWRLRIKLLHILCKRTFRDVVNVIQGILSGSERLQQRSQDKSATAGSAKQGSTTTIRTENAFSFTILLKLGRSCTAFCTCAYAQ